MSELEPLICRSLPTKLIPDAPAPLSIESLGHKELLTPIEFESCWWSLLFHGIQRDKLINISSCDWWGIKQERLGNAVETTWKISVAKWQSLFLAHIVCCHLCLSQLLRDPGFQGAPCFYHHRWGKREQMLALKASIQNTHIHWQRQVMWFSSRMWVMVQSPIGEIRGNGEHKMPTTITSIFFLDVVLIE